MQENNTEIGNYLRDYSGYMEEIKRRHQSAMKVLEIAENGGASTGFAETDIDFLYLQLRKILELIMFASVVAHKVSGTKLKAEAEKEYHAGRLIAWIESVNREFFPSPKREAASKSGMRKVEDVPQSDGGGAYLTKAEFKHLYVKVCGTFAHAQKKYSYGDAAGKKIHLARIVGWLEKIKRLLNHHWVMLSDDIAIAVVMSGRGDGKVHASQLLKIGVAPE